MKKFKWMGILALAPVTVLPCTTVLTGCSNKAFLDYSDTNNYVYEKTISGAKYDVIFLVGTSINNPTQSNGVGFNADEMKPAGFNNYTTLGTEFTSSVSNVYVPLYRQMALTHALSNYKTHNQIINDISTKEPYQDLKAFFDYYFSKINKDATRPFVIAGHSQGGASVQVVLDKYFINGGHKAYLKNMIAAYAIGYGVSEKWFNGLDRKLDGKEVLHFATGADNTNCLISWNTEGPDDESFKKGSSFLLADEGDKTLLINPMNWKTTEDEALAKDNLGILIKDTSQNTLNAKATDPEIPAGWKTTTEDQGGDKGKNNKMNAHIDLKRGSVICDTNTDYFTFEGYESIWGGRSLHIYDGRGYYKNIADNFQNRLNQFIN